MTTTSDGDQPDPMPLFSPELVKARADFRDFLDANPFSSIEEEKSDTETLLILKRPWGETSLQITLDPNSSLYEELQTCILPEKFSAIFHTKQHKLEVIWTSLKLPKDQEEILGRNFIFEYKGKTHTCSFERSSQTLLGIAKFYRQVTMSPTQGRNLSSFKLMQDDDFRKESGMPFGSPTSFYIDNIEYSEDETVELCNSISFYMTYYDHQSPRVAIHSTDPSSAALRKDRYPIDTFPKHIYAGQLDPVLLSFWEAAGEGDAARQFLYYYRILEYCSFSYLEANVRANLKKVLATPHGFGDIANILERIAVVTQDAKMNDYERFAALIRDKVDLDLLWKEVDHNRSTLSVETSFDGDVRIPALTGPAAQFDDFKARAHECVTRSFRDIRNALSHGRDQRSAGIILPTSKNLKLLRPWVNLITVAAGEVVIYKDIS